MVVNVAQVLSALELVETLEAGGVQMIRIDPIYNVCAQ